MVAQVAQRHEQAQVHAEQLRAAASHDLLGQSRQQHHRAGRYVIVSSGLISTAIIARIGHLACVEGNYPVSPFIPVTWMIPAIVVHPPATGRTPMSTSTPTRAAIPAPNRWAVLALLGVAQLMVVLDATIVNIALPSAQRSLHFSHRQPAVGRHRLRPCLRQPSAAGRQARRPVRSQVDADRRAHGLRGGVGDRRDGAIVRDARRRPGAPRRVRRAPRPLGARTADGDLPGISATGPRRSGSSARSPLEAPQSGCCSAACSPRRSPGAGACTSTS